MPHAPRLADVATLVTLFIGCVVPQHPVRSGYYVTWEKAAEQSGFSAFASFTVWADQLTPVRAVWRLRQLRQP